jgi:hypothetical protein
MGGLGSLDVVGRERQSERQVIEFMTEEVSVRECKKA